MRRGLLAAALASALALGACSNGATSSAEPVETDRVDLPKSYRFDPEAIRVDAGTTVTWTNSDDFPHNVHVLEDGRTVDLPVGGEGTLMFEEPGRYEYECSLHPQQMRGSVVVA